MATATINPAALLTGPGILYWAPLASTEPVSTVTASAFDATAWSAPWVGLGSTDEGSTFKDAISTDNLEVAESYYPVRIITTGREASWAVDLAEINKSNLKVALNGGTVATSGTGATLMTSITPPSIGAEVRGMLGWQSEDNTVRLIGYQTLQTSELGLSFKKGTDKATLSCEFAFELPSAGVPWKIYLAGVTRGA